MPPVHAVRACLITNPKSGTGGIDLAPILPVLAAHGWTIEIQQKQHGGHATELAKQAVVDGFDVVVACGGDGTVGEVVEGVIGSAVAVGVLPGGTANLWAHEIGVSMKLDEAALQLVGAQRRRVDVGRVTINGKGGQYFLLMAGLGVDAAVLTKLSKKQKIKFGMAAYLPAIGRALPRSKPFHAVLDLDGVERQSDAVQIVVGNTRRYASVTSVTPAAIVDDGRLDVCVLEPTNPVSALGQLSSLVIRKKPASHSAMNDRVGRVTVTTAEKIPLQADGGRVKQKKVKVGDDGVRYEFTVRAQELTVLVPRDYDGAIFQTGLVAESTRQKGAGRSEKSGKRWYRVVAVGVDTLSAARDKDGSVVTIGWTDQTRFTGEHGDLQTASEFLAELSEGRRVQIKGSRSKKRNLVLARELRV